MKKIYLVLIIIGILIVGWAFLRFVIGGSEDDWIKDSRGVYVKHGYPSETPDYVLEQQELINCSNYLFGKLAIGSDVRINSQCLGTCGNYAVDIVHAPRIEEDNLIENQCEDYRNGKVSHFIELDNTGEIVRIV